LSKIYNRTKGYFLPGLISIRSRAAAYPLIDEIKNQAADHPAETDPAAERLGEQQITISPWDESRPMMAETGIWRPLIWIFQPILKGRGISGF
jgi:hypothetical protein